MIRTEAEYQAALERVQEDARVAAAQRAALEDSGLTPQQVDYAMQPLLSFQAQLADEVEWYERARRRELPSIDQLTHLGRLLISLRISKGVSQRELASRLGVNEASVSRDERNEYHGLTLERAQRVLNALGEKLLIHVEATGSPEGQDDCRKPEAEAVAA